MVGAKSVGQNPLLAACLPCDRTQVVTDDKELSSQIALTRTRRCSRIWLQAFVAYSNLVPQTRLVSFGATASSPQDRPPTQSMSSGLLSNPRVCATPLQPTASVPPKGPVLSAPLATGMRYHPWVKCVASPVPCKPPWVAPSSWQQQTIASARPKQLNCCATRISNPTASAPTRHPNANCIPCFPPFPNQTKCFARSSGSSCRWACATRRERDCWARCGAPVNFTLERPPVPRRPVAHPSLPHPRRRRQRRSRSVAQGRRLEAHPAPPAHRPCRAGRARRLPPHGSKPASMQPRRAGLNAGRATARPPHCACVQPACPRLEPDSPAVPAPRSRRPRPRRLGNPQHAAHHLAAGRLLGEGYAHRA